MAIYCARPIWGTEDGIMVSSRVRVSLLIVVVFVAAVAVGFAYWGTMTGPTNPPAKHQLIVSTTTSLYETGFLDVLTNSFESKYQNINVSFISQGTGLAIQTAMRGDADIILVHDPPSELKFLEGGYGVDRKIVAYNYFVIVGPADDPAHIKGLAPLDAMRRIADAGRQGQAEWVSRGDKSGTNQAEKRLWNSCGLDNETTRQEAWYIESGTGMAATLNMANQKNAYTLSDLGSYTKNFKDGNIQLEVMVQAELLDTLNVYSAIVCDPRKPVLNETNFEDAVLFVKYLVSPEGQALFEEYGIEQYGMRLFNPYMPLLTSPNGTEVLSWIQTFAFFNNTECPTQFRYQAGDLYLGT